MKINNIIKRNPLPKPWDEGEKIPWNEPGFSKRMLKEHLSQDHDLASRRMDIVDRHVDWIRRTFLPEKTSRILDLGCGPGLYLERLAKQGYDCTGIDFSPASIEYARSRAETEGLKIDYRYGDIRTTEFGTGYDLVLFVFGEFNVFRREDAEHILGKAWKALKQGGVILLEPQTFDNIQDIGQGPSRWYTHKKGLFSDAPHIWMEEHFRDEATNTSTTRYFIVDAATGNVEKFAASVQAYTDTEYQQLMSRTGFDNVLQYPSLTGNEEGRQKGLFAMSAQRKEEV